MSSAVLHLGPLSHLSVVKPWACLRMTLKSLPATPIIAFSSHHSVSGSSHSDVAIKNNNEEVCLLVQKKVHDCNFDLTCIRCGPHAVDLVSEHRKRLPGYQCDQDK